jgi:hypothetical protein
MKVCQGLYLAGLRGGARFFHRVLLLLSRNLRRILGKECLEAYSPLRWGMVCPANLLLLMKRNEDNSTCRFSHCPYLLSVAVALLF